MNERDVRIVAVGDEDAGGIVAWDLETGECLRLLEGHTALVTGTSVTPEIGRAACRESE